jgi:hypothetical protein
MADGVYLIWSHKHGKWWKPFELGYTRRFSEAGLYSRADALQICNRSIPGAAQIKALPTLPVRLEDVLLMLRDRSGAEYVPGGEPWE